MSALLRGMRVASLPLALLLAAALVVVVGAGAPAGAANAPANGQGSTYAALAFQQWTQSVQNQGLNLNYTPTSSPAGLEAYGQNTADFAGTEAEFSELLPGSPVNVPRGFEYTPDAAGATAIMYNVALSASGQDPVTSLRLAPLTIAKIFLGKISNWDDPAISADNGGVVLPNQHITVVCRTGQSGTTALFYDFVAHTDPADYASWAAAERLLDQFPNPRSGQRELTDQHGVPVGLGHGGELHRRQPVDDRLRRVRLRQGVQRQRRLGAERLGQLGAAVCGEHQRRAGFGPAFGRHLPGSVWRVHEHQPAGLPDLRLLVHLGPMRAEFVATDV